MTLAADSDCSSHEFLVEDVNTGIYANVLARPATAAASRSAPIATS